VETIDVDPTASHLTAIPLKPNALPKMPTHQGVRVTFLAYLERARIPIQIAIGFADAVTPAPAEIPNTSSCARPAIAQAGLKHYLGNP
jgi:hypothetical protein